MPVFRSTDVEPFQMHGSVFESVVRPARGSATLCAWRLSVAPGSTGMSHRPSQEEVILVLDGELTAHLDDVPTTVGRGDVVLIPAQAQLRIDGGPAGAVAWVTTTAGLTATTADGQVLSPPWAR